MENSDLILPILLCSLPILILIFIILCATFKKCTSKTPQIQ